MAIVLKYGSPGPILASGYAAGAGHRQNEQQDDALRLWQQQQQRNFQANQSWLDRLQRTELQGAAFTQQAAQSKLGREFQAGQQTAEQTFRAGEAGLQRTFQEGQQKAILDARIAEAELDRKFQADLTDDAGRMRMFTSLPEIPEYADADQRRELGRLRGGIQDILLSPHQDRRDPDVQKKLKDAMKAYADGVASLRPSSPAAAANKGTVYADPNGVFFDEPGEGRTPINPLLEGKQRQQEQQTKKYQDSVMSRADKLLNERDDDNNPLYSEEEAGKAAIDRQDSLERIRQGLPGEPNLTKPQSPTEQYDPQAVQGYNQMQDMLGKGQKSWTSGGDQPAVQTQNTSASSFTDPKTGNVYEKRGNSWVRTK
jgi:hypothetical protein